LFDDHESIPTNEVTVTLSNVAPNPVTIISPSDGLEIDITPDNLEEEVAFIWTAASDDDNDNLSYLMSLADPDTGIWGILPENQMYNEGFEDALEGWEMSPEENTSFSIEADGNGIYNSDATLDVFEGEHCLKMWGQYDGSENYANVGQWYDVGEYGLQAGSHMMLEGMLMSHADDWIGNGNNSAYLAFYFANDTGIVDWDESSHMNASASPTDWHHFELGGVVPEGVTYVWAGVEIHQPTGDDHGSVYFDEITMTVPITQTGLFVTYGDIAMAAMEDSVNMMSIEWDVWSFDGFEGTPSSGGPRMMHLNISEELVGVDGGIALPKEFALHNNYPNPFNPVTNITYDIAQNSEVVLEIYNVMGQRVRTLAQGSHEPGRYRVLWNATNDYGQALSSGMYIYRIQAGDFVSVKKLILMK
jgi:hypothetical protein